jgi:RNA-binding protein YlmH
VNNKKAITDKYKDYNDRAFANGLAGYAEICREEYAYRYTDFLDPRQQKIAKDVLTGFSGISYRFDGGINASERCICLIWNEDYDIDREPLPITILMISWNAERKKLSHRDFLGSILGSGIKREKIGDIILDDGKAFVACSSEIAGYLLYNMNRIGSTNVSITEAQEVSSKEEKLKVIETTVASLRLDSVIGSGYGLSRSSAVEIIKSGRVRLNWEDAESPSKEVNEGDVISLRGKGRIVLEEVSGTTKKDRVKITIKKYL